MNLLIGISGVEANLPAEVAQRVSMDFGAVVLPDVLPAELNSQNLRSTADVPDPWLVRLQERLIIRQHDAILEARKHAANPSIVTVLTPVDRLAFALVNYGHDPTQQKDLLSLYYTAKRHAELFDVIAVLPWTGTDPKAVYPNQRTMMRDLLRVSAMRSLAQDLDTEVSFPRGTLPEHFAAGISADVRLVQQERYAAEIRGTPKPVPTAPTVPAYDGLERGPKD